MTTKMLDPETFDYTEYFFKTIVKEESTLDTDVFAHIFRQNHTVYYDYHWPGQGFCGDFVERVIHNYKHEYHRYSNYETINKLTPSNYISLFMSMLCPKPIEGIAPKISYYSSLAKKLQKVRTNVKPGKFIKYILPLAPDDFVAKWAEVFKDEYASVEYDVFEGTSPEDFKRIYSMEVGRMSDPTHSPEKKSLSNSCMQKSFGSLKHHPAEAYGSGDFTIYALIHDDQLYARCVVCTKTGECGPIYCTNNPSYDKLSSYLYREKEFDAFCDENTDWHGAQLLFLLNKNKNRVYLPYLDLNEKLVSIDYNSSKITIGEYDGIHTYASQTEGYVNLSVVECEECGDEVDRDDSYTSPDHSHLCSSCYHDNYTTSEYSGLTIRLEDAAEVHECHINYTNPTRSTSFTSTWSQEEVDTQAVWVEDVGEYYSAHSAYLKPDTDEYIPLLTILKEEHEEFVWCSYEHKVIRREDAVRIVISNGGTEVFVHNSHVLEIKADKERALITPSNDVPQLQYFKSDIALRRYN